MEEDYIAIKRSDLFQYIFYNEQHKEVAVLDLENIRKILDVDEVILEEVYK